MIEVFDRNLKPLGILENARAGVKIVANELWTATVTMPDDDPKNDNSVISDTVFQGNFNE